MRIGSMVRRKREAAGLTLRQLAAELSVDPSHLSMVENGKRWPGDSSLPGFATFIEIPPGKLLSLIAEEKVNAKIQTSTVVPRYRSREEIEKRSLAARDRFLERVQRSSLQFPQEYALEELIRVPISNLTTVRTLKTLGIARL